VEGSPNSEQRDSAVRNSLSLCLRQDAPIEGPASKEGANVNGDL
jgi:hypothetical protein